MSVILKNSGNTGTLHIVDEGTGREFIRFDPTSMSIVIAAGVKVIHEGDPAELPPGTKVPLDQLLLNPQQDS